MRPPFWKGRCQSWQRQTEQNRSSRRRWSGWCRRKYRDYPRTVPRRKRSADQDLRRRKILPLRELRFPELLSQEQKFPAPCMVHRSRALKFPAPCRVRRFPGHWSRVHCRVRRFPGHWSRVPCKARRSREHRSRVPCRVRRFPEHRSRVHCKMRPFPGPLALYKSYPAR